MDLKSSLRTGAFALAFALPLAALPALAQPQNPAPAAETAPTDPSKVVARANGIEITEADLAIAAEDPALQLPGVADQQKRDLLIGYLIDLKLGAKAAEAAKVGEGADFAPAWNMPATRRSSTSTWSRSRRRP
jgi:peptidyl-prolyl cis-trans isomerase C